MSEVWARRFLALIMVGFVGGCVHIKPDPPTAPPTNQQPQIKESVLQVPFQTTDLATVLNMVDDPSVVPMGKDGEGAWGDVGGGWWVKVSWSRDHFSIRGTDNAIELTTTVHYQVRIARLVGHAHVQIAQCGHDEPEATLSVGTRIAITPNSDWSFTVSPTLIGPTIGTQCKLSVANYDASNRVADIVKNILVGKLNDIKNQIGTQLQFRDKAAAAWQQLQSPIKLGPDAYFIATLTGANLAPLSVADDKVTLVGGISGIAKVAIGAPVTSMPNPLPSLQLIHKPEGFHIELPISVSYDKLSSELNQRLAGRHYPFDGHTVTINSISVYGTSDKLVVQADVGLTNRISATVYITGTLQFDALRNVIYATDLQYTVNTTNALVNVVDWFLHTEFLSVLQAEAHYDIADQVAQMRAKATAAINRPLSPHADLTGSVDNLSLLGFSLTPNDVTTYLDADGNATVALH